MLFGHMFEVIGLLFIGLLIFGPKRMIEMGQGFGKAFRELREATKEMSWPNLMGDDTHGPASNTLNQVSQIFKSATQPTPPATPPPAAPIVEGTIEHIEQRPPE